MPPPDVAIQPGPTPAVIAQPTPVQYPSSILGDKIPQSALIPSSHQQGKDEFQQYMPKITADPGTTDYFRQRQEQLNYKAEHPWGAPISPHPGVLGSILHGLSVAGNIAGDVVDPGAMSLIPGTQLHNAALARGNEAGIEQGEKNDAEQAQTGLTKATTEHTQAQTDALQNPSAKVGATPEEQTIHDLMAGNNGAPQINPATKKPYSYLEAYMAVQQAKEGAKPQKPEKENDFEKFYADWLKDNSFPDTAHNRLLARSQFAVAGQTPQRPQQQLAVGPDGKVLEVKPGMTLPQGAKTLSGDLAGAKPNAEELKRAEMAENVNENLDKLEEIVKRRPDLFGPVAGRMTEARMWAGSNDPDVGVLKTIHDNLGMAAQSAHSMRSAQHVETSANSVLNGFKNGPDAVLASAKALRDSVKTFTKDVQEGNPSTKKTPEKKDADPLGIR